MNYQLTLTAAEIKEIKKALWDRSLNLRDQIESGTNKILIDHKKRMRGNVEDVYQKVSEQLSDQQPDVTPLSQREYPQ